jgi:glucose-6-phosphate isomerase
MSNSPLTERGSWKALVRHAESMKSLTLRALFKADPQRFDKFHVNCDGLLLDYSKHNISEETLILLMQLAQECGVEDLREAMFNGAPINTTENRAVLHVALRGSVDENLTIEGENVAQFVNSTLEKIQYHSENIRKSQVTDVVNIGIGGSDLGPRMVCEALRHFADGPRLHFVSNIDGAHISETLSGLKPETTVFIIASKTFTTLETMTNAHTALGWSGRVENFIGVTSNEKAALEFGIAPDHILPMRDWVGGRYSLWAAIGLPIAVSAGFENFKKLLQGACAMDTHFRTAPLKDNIPVIMAMLGVWYRNFFDYRTHAVIPYAENLQRFSAYIQQLDMESNGKHVDREGRRVNYATAPVVFGEPGTNAQHAFFQLLHQGTDITPCDFIAAVNPTHDLPGHHTRLLANMLAQARALMQGQPDAPEPHKKFEGNRPSSTILLENLNPEYLGMLLALYEHKFFVQGVIWNINSFDQWGVELGKSMARNITHSLNDPEQNAMTDSSTEGLVSHIQKLQG